MIDAPQNSTERDWEAFLSSGFLLRWNEEEWLVGHTEEAPRNSNNKKGLLYTPDFFLEAPNNWRKFSKFFKVSHEEMVEHFSPTKARLGWFWDEPSSEEFMRQTEAIRSEMIKHVLKKAVPVVFAKSQNEVNKEVKKHLIRHIVNTPYQMGYGYWTENSGIMGVSPELLFEMKDLELRTMALASTGRVDGPSLLEDEKEVLEHQIVVDDLIQQFKEEQSFQRGKTLEWNVGIIKHLLTLITVQLKEPREAIEIIKKLHPTPALGVAPRSFDWKWLKEFSQNRFRFGAPFGFADCGGVSRFVVGIRNIQWTGSEVLLGSGCGFLEKSIEENEWEELELKRNSVKKILGL